MTNHKFEIINQKWFLGLSLMLLVALGLALIYIPKADLHLLLCDRHAPARDIFYRYYTTVAEWFPYVICVLLLLFGRVGNGIFASSAMILSALSTQLIKHIVNAPRPVTWFAANCPDIQLPLVDGVRMNLWYSFPSGHTTSFFALALVASILATQKILSSNSKSVCQCNGLSAAGGPTTKWSVSAAVQLLLFIAATIGAYSRIYLSQHFALDVFAGILVGTLITILCYAVLYRFQDQKWYNYRLFSKK
jgi:membrane-associated phospholipid phosphatase